MSAAANPFTPARSIDPSEACRSGTSNLVHCTSPAFDLSTSTGAISVGSWWTSSSPPEASASVDCGGLFNVFVKGRPAKGPLRVDSQKRCCDRWRPTHANPATSRNPRPPWAALGLLPSTYLTYRATLCQVRAGVPHSIRGAYR